MSSNPYDNEPESAGMFVARWGIFALSLPFILLFAAGVVISFVGLNGLLAGWMTGIPDVAGEGLDGATSAHKWLMAIATLVLIAFEVMIWKLRVWELIKGKSEIGHRERRYRDSILRIFVSFLIVLGLLVLIGAVIP